MYLVCEVTHLPGCTLLEPRSSLQAAYAYADAYARINSTELWD